VLPPFTLRDRTTTIALDMLRHHALTGQSLRDTLLVEVVMEETAGEKPVKLDRGGRRDIRTGQG
jgi:hypothetical protein